MRHLKIFLILLIFMFNILYANQQVRIINGEQVSVTNDKYKSIVALIDNYNTQFCAGTLISPQWVVTAAHCLSGVSTSEIKIMLDSYDLNNFNTVIGVSRIIQHQNYSGRDMSNDIGLIKLSSVVTNVIPIEPHTTGTLNYNQDAWVAGWGNTKINGESFSDKLRDALVPIIDTSICNGINSYNGEITSNQICAGYMSGPEIKDSCQGDSGGPLIIENNSRYELAGIVSFGGSYEQACAAPDFPGIYTKVKNYNSWIRSYIDNNEEPPVDDPEPQVDNFDPQFDDFQFDEDFFYNEGVDFCKANPSDCGIKTSFTLLDVENLGIGQWYLVGTTNSITDLSIFGAVQVAFIYQDGQWKANSLDSDILNELLDKGYEIFTKIPANSGIWIKK